MVESPTLRPGADIERRWTLARRYGASVIVAVIAIVGTWFAARRQPAAEPLDALAIVLLVVGAAILAFRDRYPATVYVVAFLTTLAYVALGYPGGPIYGALIVGLFAAIVRGRRVVAWIGLAVGYVLFPLAGRLGGVEAGLDTAGLVALGAWLLLLGGSAEYVRLRRERTAAAALSREQAERRRAGEERLRIARELHDVLAHNISLINVQAGVALHLIEERPEQARVALTAIKQASKDTLGELRSVLDILRDPTEANPRSPTGGLDHLDEIVSRASGAGLDVRTEIDGERRSLPASVDLTAYRIVQEAITNVIRHAGASRATVTLAYGEDELVVLIDDDGRGGDGAAQRARDDAATEGTGSGIAGMRDRAVALGGSLRAGPRPEGGFRVVAHLPLEERS